MNGAATMAKKPTRKEVMRGLLATCREELGADAIVLIVTGTVKRGTFMTYEMDGNRFACQGILAEVYGRECEPEPDDDEDEDDEEDADIDEGEEPKRDIQ